MRSSSASVSAGGAAWRKKIHCCPGLARRRRLDVAFASGFRRLCVVDVGSWLFLGQCLVRRMALQGIICWGWMLWAAWFLCRNRGTRLSEDVVLQLVQASLCILPSDGQSCLPLWQSWLGFPVYLQSSNPDVAIWWGMPGVQPSWKPVMPLQKTAGFQLSLLLNEVSCSEHQEDGGGGRRSPLRPQKSWAALLQSIPAATAPVWQCWERPANNSLVIAPDGNMICLENVNCNLKVATWGCISQWSSQKCWLMQVKEQGLKLGAESIT